MAPRSRSPDRFLSVYVKLFGLEMSFSVAGTASEPTWRLLRPKAARTAVLPMVVTAVVALLIGLTISNDSIAPPLLATATFWVMLRVFLWPRAELGSDRAWLISICELAFFVRVLAAVVIYSGPWDRYQFSEDQAGYDYVPQIVVARWEGLILNDPFSNNPDIQNRFGYYGLVASLYYMFGVHYPIPRIFNCLGGALVVYYAYRLAALAFGAAEARIAALWCAFLPSLVLWSSLNMRDIWLAVSVLAILYHTLRCRERLAMFSVLVIAANMIWLQNTRFYLVIIMAGAVATMFLPIRAGHLPRDVFLAVVFGFVVLALRQLFGLGQDALEWLDLDKIAQRRTVLARADVGVAGYLPGVDLTNPLVLMPFIPLAVVYFLYSPFPWQLTAFRRIITIPDLLVWYWMIPSLWTAVRSTARLKSSSQLAVLLAIGVITTAFAITSSNVGLAYRYRAQVIGPLLVLAAAGYLRRRAPAVRGVAAHVRAAPRVA